mgnify:CR=1 FL=1
MAGSAPTTKGVFTRASSGLVRQVRTTDVLYFGFTTIALSYIVFTIAFWGVVGILKHPAVLTAVNPVHAIRFFIEFYREPDAHLGFVLGPFSMGQLLCFAMIAAGRKSLVASL